MSFLAGKISLTRFKVSGAKPRIFTDEHLERLRSYSATVLDAQPEPDDKIRKGWTAGVHIQDCEFTEEKNIYPDHLYFEYRELTNRLPQDLLKSIIQLKIKTITAEKGKEKPDGQIRKQAKSEAREELEHDAKDGRYKKWKCIPVLWDLIRNEVYFAASGDSTAERFAWLFEATFGESLNQTKLAGKLKPRDAANLALDIDRQCKNTMLAIFHPGQQPEARWSPDTNVPRFLGNEFIIWLWWNIDNNHEDFDVGEDNPITVFFSGGIRLDSNVQKDSDTINADCAVKKTQAMASLRNQNFPRKAAITLIRNGDQFPMKLHAETFQISAAHFIRREPEPPKEGEKPPEPRPRGRLEDRFAMIRDMVETLDLLFGQYVKLRISPEWDGTLGEIQEWIHGDKVPVADLA